MIVILDPGHSSKTPGKRSPDGRLLEYKWAREMIEILEKKLDLLGIQHIRTTEPSEDDVEISLRTRCERANKIKNSILVSIHCNAASADGKWHSANGWSVFVSLNASNNSKRLAGEMKNQAVKSGIKVRVPSPKQGYWEQNLAMCRDTKMPAVLVENMFQDNVEDVNFLLSAEGKEILSNIIIDGIKNYVG